MGTCMARRRVPACAFKRRRGGAATDHAAWNVDRILALAPRHTVEVERGSMLLSFERPASADRPSSREVWRLRPLGGP